MPRLGEFIGALLSDSVQARVRADLESLKVAEAYSQHDLLKHLPVPRFRLPDITIDFPVVVAALEGEPPVGSGQIFDAPATADTRRAVERAVADAGLRLTSADQKKVSAAVDGRVKTVFAAGPRVLLSSARLANDFAATAVAAVKEVVRTRDAPADQLMKFEGAMKTSMRALLLTKLTQSPYLQVLVGSDEIKAHGDTSSLLRVRLTITEDAYEVIDRDDGTDTFILTPE